MSASLAEPQPAVVLRRATGTDAARLTEFYRKHFADRPRLNDSALWRWEFTGQPGAERHFPFFVLDSGTSIEGGIGYVRFTLRVCGFTVAGVHPVNYFVNPSFKGLHALRLFRSALSEASLVIGSNFSVSAMQLLKRTGFVDLSNRFQAYYLPLPNLDSGACATGKVRRATAAFLRRLWLATANGASRIRAPKIRYELTEEMDVSWLPNVESWRLADCSIVKDSTYLAWRYGRSPALNCRYVWQISGDRPVGLAIMHLDLVRSEAVLLDCLAEKDDMWLLLGLIGQTMVHSGNAGAATWTTQALSAPLDRVLRSLGCRRGRSTVGFRVFCADATLREYITDPNRWHFMIGDTDVF